MVILVITLSLVCLNEGGPVPIPAALAGLKTDKSEESSMVLPLKRSELKKDWCVGRSFMQEVRHHGCQPAFVKNKFCYGQCTTFYIPRHRYDAFNSCSQCVPVRTETIEVKMKCEGDVPTRKKKVTVVKKCGCKSCEFSQFFLRNMHPTTGTHDGK